MFIEVEFKTKGGERISRFINLDTISYMQVVANPDDREKNPEGYQTVMYNNGGFALYSKLTPQEIIGGVGYSPTLDEKGLLAANEKHKAYRERVATFEQIQQLEDY